METNQTNEVLSEYRPKSLPGMLNVLTILTFIGCAFGYISAIWGMVGSADPEKQTEKMREQMDKMDSNSFWYKWMEGSIETLQKTHDNRYLILITSLIFVTLCLIGAIKMRKLQKSGYFYYLIGELAPLVLMAGLIGSSFAAMIQLSFGAFFALLFVILYSTQLKHLVNK